MSGSPFQWLKIFLRVLKSLGHGLVIRRGEIDDRFAQHAAHTRFFGGARDGVFKVIHVGVAGDAAAQHFEHAEARSPGDEILGYVASFGGENVFLEPVVEREVVGDSAEQAHRGVRVAVDQAGENEGAARVDDFCGVELRFDFGPRTHRNDRIASNGNGAVFDDPLLGVHCDDGAAGDENIGFLFCRGGENRETTDEHR